MDAKLVTGAFTTQQIPLELGIVPAGYLSWLTRDNVTVEMKQLSAAARHVTYTVIEHGVYVVRVIRVSDTGTSIGQVAESEPFEITHAMVEVPLKVTVSVGDFVALPK